MRRGVLVASVALTVVPAVEAAPPAIAASAAAGIAPFTVTLTGPPETVWDLGDGTKAVGPAVEHVYARPGRYVVTGSANGEAAQVTVTAYRIAFEAPSRARYGRRGRFTGSIWPAAGSATVEILRPDGRIAYRGRTRSNGGFVLNGRVLKRGPFRARVAGLMSEPDAILLRPAIEARLVGSGVVGEPLRLVTRARPTGAGVLTTTIWRNGRRAQGLSTRSPASYRVVVAVRPAEGYLPATRTLRAAVLRPQLGLGSRGASVRALKERLRDLRYALPHVDGLYGLDTFQAVLAFQKVEGLPRTGRVDARTWRALTRAQPPRARYGGTHLEVSKGRQVLFVVRDGRVQSVVHVSTGATGNTPLGRWRIYRKVSGWDWVLWYPMYFLRGFAIHGYPSVPAYPASHGCVRVPMWIAPRLHAAYRYGQTVYVYW